MARQSPADDTYYVRLMVRDESQRKLKGWTRDRVGQPIGVVLNGRLQFVDTLHAPFWSTLTIPGLNSLDEALRTCATVQVDGDLSKVDERLQVLTLEHDKALTDLQRLRDARTREGPRPEEFEIVSVRKKPDDRHKQPIDGPDGDWWYRDPEAGLRACSVRKAFPPASRAA